MACVSPKEKHRAELLGKSLSLLLGIGSGNSVPQFLPAQVLVSFSSQIPHFCAMHFLWSITQTPIPKRITGDATACRDTRQLQCALGSTCFQTPSHSYLAPLQPCTSRHPPTGAQPSCQPTARASTSQRAHSLLLEEEKEIFELFTLQLTPVPQIKTVRTANPKNISLILHYSKALFCSKILHLLQQHC